MKRQNKITRNISRVECEKRYRLRKKDSMTCLNYLPIKEAIKLAGL